MVWVSLAVRLFVGTTLLADHFSESVVVLHCHCLRALDRDYDLGLLLHSAKLATTPLGGYHATRGVHIRRTDEVLLSVTV